MAVGSGNVQAAPMQSPVNWGLLGLVVERPSYAYELAQRFERTYAGALSLSSISHAYTALGTLREKGLVEELAGSREGRQPKPVYRPTELGLRSYLEWLVGEAGEEARRRRLFVTQLAALARNPELALDTLNRYEQACLAEAKHHSMGEHGRAGEDGGLLGRLVAEEQRVAVEAKLAWVQFARGELKPLVAARTASR